MYIKSIEITNYRIFYKTHYFNFNSNQNKFLNVIFGKNSSGKSSLIDAISWCLYGKEIRKKGSEPICNDEIVNEIKVNDEIPVKVILTCINKLEREIKIHRSVSFYKNEYGKIIQADNIFNIFIDDVPVISPELFLLKNCSLDLFDLSYIGENEILLDSNFKNKILSIFGNYFQFDIVDGTLIHLKKSYDKFLKKYEKSSSEIYHINMHNRYVEELEKISQEIDNVNNEIFKLNELYESYSNEINSNDVKLRERLLKELEHIDNNLNKSINDYNYLVLKSFPMAFFVSNLCSKSQGIKTLSDFLSEENFNPVLYGEINYLKRNLVDLKAIISDISNGIKSISYLKDDYVEISYKLQAIQDNLRYTDKDWIKKMEHAENSIKFSRYKLDSLKHKKKKIEMEINVLDKKLKEIQTVSKEFRKKDAFYKNAFDTLEFVRKEFKKDILNNISSLMNNIFIHDFAQSDKFSSISISENFEFVIVKNSGKHISFSDLSYSERYIFYLSFMFSIQEVIEQDIFLIIDTKFLNFDRKHWSNFLSLLKNNCNQCFLLFNETMYDDVTKSNLKSNINTEHELAN